MEKLSSFKAQPENIKNIRDSEATAVSPDLTGNTLRTCFIKLDMNNSVCTRLNGTSVVIFLRTALLETSHYCTGLLARRTHLKEKRENKSVT